MNVTENSKGKKKLLANPWNSGKAKLLKYSKERREIWESVCDSVGKTMDFQPTAPRFKSAYLGSCALGQGTLSAFPSPMVKT